MGLFSTSKGASNTGTTGKGAQQKQVAPGQFFRVPGMSTRPRFIPEGGNKNVRATLLTGQTATAPTVKFDQADIIKGYLAVVNFTGTYTPGTGVTISPSPFAPMNLITRIKVQYEATYAPVNLSGIMAAVFQLYRPLFSAPDSVGLLLNDSANAIGPYANKPLGGWPTPNTQLTKSSGFTGAISGLYNFTLFFEIAVSVLFDLYWPLNKTGSLANSQPLPRRIISPQYMAATTRNNVPQITFANPLSTGATNVGKAPLAFKSAGAATVTPTFTGHTVTSIHRSAWFPGNRAVTPPIDPWQYARQEINWPTNGTTSVTIPLDSQEADQGQIMSIIGYVYDPQATGGKGAVVPSTKIALVSLLYSSDVFIKQQTPATNQYLWATKHGSILPVGWFGWDLALTDDGRLTNEELLNTLIQSGVQVRINFKTTASPPSSTAQVYLGIESLKFVTQ